MKTFHQVTFLPEGKILQVEHLKTIFETIGKDNPDGIQLQFACGSEGICRKCKIRAFQKMGPLTPTERGCLSGEEIARGVRLACQARVIQDMQAEIIFKRPFTIECVDEPAADIGLTDPAVRKVHVPAAARAVTAADVLRALGRDPSRCSGDSALLSQRLGEADCAVFFQTPPADCTAVLYDGDLLCLEAGDTTALRYAVAVDLGENTVTAALVDMAAGRTKAIVTDTNPQIELGGDLEARIDMVADDPLNLEVLNEELLLRIDILIEELCRARGVSPLHVYEIAIAGTTGMMHLYLKSVPGVLEQQAFSCRGGGAVFAAHQLDLRAPQRAMVTTLPAVSAYVGPDVTAAVLGTRLHTAAETTLLLDLGTTVKAVLHHQGSCTASHVAGCGAFSGAGLCCGMRPEHGAVYSVGREGRDLRLGVIGESLPRGICGRGLLELSAVLLDLGLLTPEAALQPPSGDLPAGIAGRIVAHAGCAAFLLYRDAGEFETDILVTRDDFQALLRARARTCALVQHLLAARGIGCAALEKVLVTGAFGPPGSPDPFLVLGFFSPALRERIACVGNMTQQGGQMALFDRRVLEDAEHLVRALTCLDPPPEAAGEPFARFDAAVQ